MLEKKDKNGGEREINGLRKTRLVKMNRLETSQRREGGQE